MILSVLFAMMFSLVVAQAEETAPPAKPDKAVKTERPAKPAPAPAVEVTITGKLAKDMAKRGKPGEEKEYAVYSITDAQGTKYTVPAPKAAKGTAAINLDDFVGKDVTLTGKAKTQPKRGGKEGETVTTLVQVITVVAAAAQ